MSNQEIIAYWNQYSDTDHYNQERDEIVFLYIDPVNLWPDAMIITRKQYDRAVYITNFRHDLDQFLKGEE